MQRELVSGTYYSVSVVKAPETATVPQKTLPCINTFSRPSGAVQAAELAVSNAKTPGKSARPKRRRTWPQHSNAAVIERRKKPPSLSDPRLFRSTIPGGLITCNQFRMTRPHFNTQKWGRVICEKIVILADRRVRCNRLESNIALNPGIEL